MVEGAKASGKSVHLIRELWRAAVFDAGKRRSPTGMNVLLALSDAAGWKHDRAWGCVGALARDLGLKVKQNGTKLGDKSAVRAVLCKAGKIGLHRRHRRGDGLAPEFALVFPDPAIDPWSDRDGSDCRDCGTLNRGQTAALAAVNLNSIPLNSYSSSTRSPSSARVEGTDQLSHHRKRAFEGFLGLVRAYPVDATMHLCEAEQLFEALSLEDQLKAAQATAVYASNLQGRNRRHPIGIGKWIRTRAFEKIETAIINAIPAPARLSAPAVPAADLEPPPKRPDASAWEKLKADLSRAAIEALPAATNTSRSEREGDEQTD